MIISHDQGLPYPLQKTIAAGMNPVILVTLRVFAVKILMIVFCSIKRAGR